MRRGRRTRKRRRVIINEHRRERDLHQRSYETTLDTLDFFRPRDRLIFSLQIPMMRKGALRTLFNFRYC